MKLYELEPEEDRRREEEVRPGPPYEIAAKKTTETLGIELSEEQLRKMAMCSLGTRRQIYAKRTL